MDYYNKPDHTKTDPEKGRTVIETERLILRPWNETDAPELYRYASDDRVGPIAGWPVHTSTEFSRDIIRNVLSAPFTYAMVLKETGLPVGSIGLMMKEQSNLDIKENEAEIGYWIGVPYWGRGLTPEAVRKMVSFGFEDLGLERIWCGYFDGNIKSKRAQEKCGFVYRYTLKDQPWPLMGDIRTEHITCLERNK